MDWAIDKDNLSMVTRVYNAESFFEEYPKRLDVKGLAVAPKCQGKRIGSVLINDLKRIARGYGAVLALTSKNMSRAVYLRHGFREIGMLKFEHTGVESPAMIWEPEEGIKANSAGVQNVHAS